MRNQKSEVITNFQLKKSGKKYVVFLVIGANLKSQGRSTVVKNLSKKITDGKIISESETINTITPIKYSYLYVTTGIEGEPINWDKKRKRFIGENPFNIQLNNIETLSKEVFRKYRPAIKGSGFIEMPYLREAINKLVFGKITPEHKIIIKDKQITDIKQINFENNHASTRNLQIYPRFRGDSVQLMDKAIEFKEKETNRNKILTTRFSDYIEKMREERFVKGEISYQSKKGYRNLTSFVLEYEKECQMFFHIRDINEKWCVDFLSFARKRKRENGTPYSYNYINETIQKLLKATCNYLKANEKVDLEIEWQVKSLKKSKEKTQEVALTIQQLKMLLDLDLNPSKDSKIQLSCDIFTVMCLTGLRVSDFKNLNLEEQQNGDFLLNQITQKTKTQIQFLVHPKVVEIYKKYNGKIPTISDQKLNKNIQNIGKIAVENKIEDFARKVVLKRKDPSNPNKIITSEPVPFYKLIKSSTARRTFATWAVHSNSIPLDMICKVTGHSKISQLMEYCKVSEAELNSNLTTLYKTIEL